MPNLNLAWDFASHVLPFELAKVMHDELRVSGIRYLIQTPQIAPYRGRLDLSFVRATIENAHAAGLHVVPNMYFYPSWITGGLDAMSSYDCACTKGAVSLPPESAPAFCYDKVPINSEWLQELAEQIGEFFRSLGIDEVGIDNEPGMKCYFSTSRDDDGQTAIERWYRQCAVPLATGFRAAIPNVKLVAQFDEFCDSAYALSLEKQGVRTFDRIGIHPYNDVKLGEQGFTDASGSTRAMLNKHLPNLTREHRLVAHHDRLALRSTSTRDHRRDLRKLASYVNYMLPTAAPGRHLFTSRNIVTGELLTTYDVDATTDNVISMVGTFHERLDPFLDGRPMEITEIQHVDVVRLMNATKLNVTDHDPARYIGIVLQWAHGKSGTLELQLASKSGKWELTDEGRMLRDAMWHGKRRGARS